MANRCSNEFSNIIISLLYNFQPIGGVKKLGPGDLGPQKTTTTSNDTGIII